MSGEVTYATVKFSKSSETELEESSDYKPTDDHEVPAMELSEEAENRRKRVESTVEMVKSRAVKGHRNLWKIWCPFAFISLLMNVVVLAGLGTLFFWNFHKSIMCNTTEIESQGNLKDMIDNLTFLKNTMGDFVSEYILLKNKTCCAIATFTNCTHECYDKTQGSILKHLEKNLTSLRTILENIFCHCTQWKNMTSYTVSNCTKNAVKNNTT